MRNFSAGFALGFWALSLSLFSAYFDLGLRRGFRPFFQFFVFPTDNFTFDHFLALIQTRLHRFQLVGRDYVIIDIYTFFVV